MENQNANGVSANGSVADEHGGPNLGFVTPISRTADGTKLPPRQNSLKLDRSHDQKGPNVRKMESSSSFEAFKTPARRNSLSLDPGSVLDKTFGEIVRTTYKLLPSKLSGNRSVDSPKSTQSECAPVWLEAESGLGDGFGMRKASTDLVNDSFRRGPRYKSQPKRKKEQVTVSQYFGFYLLPRLSSL